MGFFKAYDMRGTFGVDFDFDTVYEVGKALAKVVGGKRWLVGRDVRETSHEMSDALASGLQDGGVAEVHNLGLCTTPMVYFFTAEDDFDASVMVTASHNPPSDNGLKVSKRGSLPVGYADGLDEVERIVREAERNGAPKQQYRFADDVGYEGDYFVNGIDRYVAWMRKRMPDLSGLKFAIDCSSGMAAQLVHYIFPQALVINGHEDGEFKAHSPNPLDPAAREQLSETVREHGLDCGVIFDGDADRCMFVDESGRFIQPDYFIPVVAKATLEASEGGLSPKGGARVIHDVRTSRGAIDALRELGCEPVMVPVGHAFAKPRLREVGAICGGELAGHYYFREFHGCDSGVLAAMRILGEIARARREGFCLSRMMRPYVGAYVNSGELNYRVEDKDAAIARILEAAKRNLPPEMSRSEMDGVRVEYEAGWFNVRKSNTEPYLRLIVECANDTLMREWKSIFEEAIHG